jgi:predicted enzyme related to lactoylglutathione lyase
MSLKLNPVNWFEIPVNDMRRAIKFYEQAFGFNLSPTEVAGNPYAFFPMERGAAGAGGTLAHSPGGIPSHQGTTVYSA